MLREGLNALVELVKKSQNCEIVRVPGEPSHVYGLLNRENGEVDWRETETEPRSHFLFTLEDFVSAVKAFRVKRELEADEADDQGPSIERDRAALPSVFCGEGCVCAVLDEPEPRRETVTMSLAWSREFDFLDPNKFVPGSDGAIFDLRREHAEFINMLRIDLGQAVLPADLLAFRNVKILTQAERESKQQPGREALSTDVKRAISSGGNDVPDEITLSLFVYRDLVEPREELLQKVLVAVIVDLAAGTFTIRPICGELERAQRRTDAWIRNTLETKLDGVARVFCGARSSSSKVALD